MSRIKFLRDEIYENEGPGKGPKFPEGSVWDCTEEFADRWVNRNAAVLIGKGEPKDGERYTRVKGKDKDEAAGDAAATAPAAAPEAAPAASAAPASTTTAAAEPKK